MEPVRLSVNVDHVATVRSVRVGNGAPLQPTSGAARGERVR